MRKLEKYFPDQMPGFRVHGHFDPLYIWGSFGASVPAGRHSTAPRARCCQGQALYCALLPGAITLPCLVPAAARNKHSAVPCPRLCRLERLGETRTHQGDYNRSIRDWDRPATGRHQGAWACERPLKTEETRRDQ